MPRRQRVCGPRDILGIVGRGHEGRPIFATEDDRRFFVERLGRIFVPGDVELHGGAVRINHYRLIAQRNGPNFVTSPVAEQPTRLAPESRIK